MITTILSFVTGFIVPLATKGIESFTKAKIEEKQTNNTIAIAQSNNAKEMYVSDNEVVKAEMELAKSANELSKVSTATKTGYKWIDASISLVRALFGFGDLAIFLASAVNLWLLGSVILTQPEVSQAFFIVLGFFFGERSVKKAWGR